MARLDGAAIKAAAQGRWLSLCAALGIAVSGNPRKHSPCPACGEGKDRFRFDDRDGHGTFFCNVCGPGDGFALVQRVKRCTFREALQMISDALGSPAVHREPRIQPRTKATENEYTAAFAARLWSEAGKDAGRIQAYLVSRGLSGHVPESLRFHPRLKHQHTEPDGTVVETYHPGIVAQVMGLNGPLPAVHRIYLDSDSDGKAKVEKNKKALGSISGGAIRLSPYQPRQPLVLCEGAETGLAVQESTGWQTWACISATGLEAVRVPDDCGPIYIAGDLDKNQRGQQAAEKLAARLLTESPTRTVSILLPPGPIPDGCKGIDWLDVLNSAQSMEGNVI
jgi:putative DNA primase/helicase